MAEFDHGIKLIAERAGRPLARLAGLECTRWEPLESTLQATTERLADRVFLAGRGRERFVVYFEFYTTWDKAAPWSMLAKSGLLSERERLPTVCVPVILQSVGYVPPGEGLHLEAAGGPTQHLWFREIRLWEQKPQPWWEEQPGLMALYPLCDHGQRGVEAAALHATRAIGRQVPEEVERSNWLSLLGIFVGLAAPAEAEDIWSLIRSEDMNLRENAFVQAIMKDGRIENSREIILEFLNGRFPGQELDDIGAAVNALSDLPALKKLVALSATCADLDAFRAGLAPKPKKPARKKR